jgi:hypothetical protein
MFHYLSNERELYSVLLFDLLFKKSLAAIFGVPHCCFGVEGAAIDLK